MATATLVQHCIPRMRLNLANLNLNQNLYTTVELMWASSHYLSFVNGTYVYPKRAEADVSCMVLFRASASPHNQDSTDSRSRPFRDQTNDDEMANRTKEAVKKQTHFWIACKWYSNGRTNLFQFTGKFTGYKNDTGERHWISFAEWWREFWHCFCWALLAIDRRYPPTLFALGDFGFCYFGFRRSK